MQSRRLHNVLLMWRWGFMPKPAQQPMTDWSGWWHSELCDHTRMSFRHLCAVDCGRTNRPCQLPSRHESKDIEFSKDRTTFSHLTTFPYRQVSSQFFAWNSGDIFIVSNAVVFRNKVCAQYQSHFQPMSLGCPGIVIKSVSFLSMILELLPYALFC